MAIYSSSNHDLLPLNSDYPAPTQPPVMMEDELDVLIATLFKLMYEEQARGQHISGRV